MTRAAEKTVFKTKKRFKKPHLLPVTRNNALTRCNMQEISLEMLLQQSFDAGAFAL
jgi:hypothetical protein